MICTSYTHDLQEGKDTLKDFVRKCVGAFVLKGALEAKDHARERLEEVEVTRRRIVSLTNDAEKLEQVWKAEKNKHLASCREANAKIARSNARCMEAAEALAAVDYTEDYERFFDFMREQLTKVMQDQKVDITFMHKFPAKKQWLDEELRTSAKQLDRAHERLKKAEQKHEETEAWLKGICEMFDLSMDELELGDR